MTDGGDQLHGNDGLSHGTLRQKLSFPKRALQGTESPWSLRSSSGEQAEGWRPGGRKISAKARRRVALGMLRELPQKMRTGGR